MPGEAVYLLFGVWALAILVVFIQAIRLSYRIEARSPDLTNRSGFPSTSEAARRSIASVPSIASTETQARSAIATLCPISCSESEAAMRRP